MESVCLLGRPLAALGVLALAGLAAPVGAESFDVTVLRGAEVVRVRGDESGARSEEVLRKAPPAPAVRPPDEPPEPQRTRARPIVVYLEEPGFDDGYGYRYGSAPVYVPSHGPVRSHRGAHRVQRSKAIHRFGGGARAHPNRGGGGRMRIR